MTRHTHRKRQRTVYNYQSLENQAVDNGVKFLGAFLAVWALNPPQEIANEVLDRTAEPALTSTMMLGVASLLRRKR